MTDIKNNVIDFINPEDNISKESKKENNECEIPKQVRKIHFNTYIKQLLNGNEIFIYLLNRFIIELKTIDKIIIRNNIIEYFADIYNELLITILNTENITELIDDEIEPTYDNIIDEILNIVMCHCNINDFYIHNFPNTNMDLVKPCHYTYNIYNISARLGFSKFYNFYFTQFCNQPPIDINISEYDSLYMNYIYNIKTSNFEFQTYYKPLQNIHECDISFSISYNKDIINIDVVDHVFLYRIIRSSSEKGNRFTFFPLTYSMYKEFGHACYIIFDNIYKNIYLFDPNGTTSYLSQYIVKKESNNQDNQCNVSLPYVTDIFHNYVKIFNEINNENYKFVIEDNALINISSINSYNYDSGHCVILAMLIIYLLYAHQELLSEKVMQDICNRFKYIGNKELNIMKYNFAANLVKIGKENNIITKNIFHKWFK